MKILISIIAASIALMSCGTSDKEEKEVGYSIAHGYFVRNDAPTNAPNYYDNQKDFFRVFGEAAVMGHDGMPTEIDFTRKSVVAIIGGETNRPTEFIPLSLTLQSDTLYLKYQKKEARPTTYTMNPLLLLIIDKQNILPYVKLQKQ